LRQYLYAKLAVTGIKQALRQRTFGEQPWPQQRRHLIAALYLQAKVTTPVAPAQLSRGFTQ
jgi:hypothetical protein